MLLLLSGILISSFLVHSASFVFNPLQIWKCCVLLTVNQAFTCYFNDLVFCLMWRLQLIQKTWGGGGSYTCMCLIWLWCTELGHTRRSYICMCLIWLWCTELGHTRRLWQVCSICLKGLLHEKRNSYIRILFERFCGLWNSN